MDHRAYQLDAVATVSEKLSRVVEHARFKELSRPLQAKVIRMAREAENVFKRTEQASVVLYGVSAGLASHASTGAGQVTEGVLATLGFKAIGAVPGVTYDLILNALGEKILGKHVDEMAGGYLSGHTIGTPSALAVAYGEAFVTGDMQALDTFAQRARAGKYGVLYQFALRVGDKVAGPLSESMESAAQLWNQGRDFLKAR